METKISSKSELSSLASRLMSQSAQLKSVAGELKSVLSGISNYEDINVSGAGSILASNVANIATDMDTISLSIKNYIADIEEFDKYDFDVEAALNGDFGNLGPNIGGGVPVTPEDSMPDYETEQSTKPVGQPRPSNPKPSSPKPSGSGTPVQPVQPTYSPVQDDNPSKMENFIVDENDTTNNTPDVQYTDNSGVSVNTNSNVGNSNSGLSDVPVTENPVVDSGNLEGQIPNDILDNEFSDDVYVNDQSGYIGQTNNNVSSNVNTNSNSSNNGSAIPGILGGLGAAAVVGLGAVGGAKVIKNMKENQEIDEDDDEE